MTGYRPKKLLNIDANPKTVKGQKAGFLTAVLYLSPASLSGYNVCPQATNACKWLCLNTAGRAGIYKAGEETNVIQIARIAKTRWYFEDRPSFLATLALEIGRFLKKAAKLGLTPVIRLNGTSDLPWERVEIFGCANFMELFPDVQFYDYTKVAKRCRAKYKARHIPANYDLTYSLAEDNDGEACAVLRGGGKVAAIFFGKDLPAHMDWTGHKLVSSSRTCFDDNEFPVTNGDLNDLRFLDKPGSIAGLSAKGKAKKDPYGMVRWAT